METLPGGYTLSVPEGCFPLGTDSMVLGDFVRLPKNARVLDLGSGCGSLGLLLCSRDSRCHVTGVEISETAHRAAEENIRRNCLQDRMESLCADLTRVPTFLSPGSFSLCLSNPPYFSGGPESRRFSTARREDLCSPGALFAAAAWALKFGGDFYLVHRPERLGELLGEAYAAGMACKRLRLLRHRAGGPVTLILLQLRKGGRPGMILEELSLLDSQGNPTEDYQRIYHI